MADISEIVTVNATIQDASPSADSFGIALLLGYTTGFSGMKSFTTNSAGLAALVAAGVPTSHPLYLMLSSAARQSPKTSLVKVFARTTHAVQVYSITPTVLTQGYTTSFGVTDGTTTATVSYTNGPSETAITIATALAAALTAAAVGTVTGTHSGSNTFFTTGVSAGTQRYHLFAIDPSLTVADTSSDGGIATDLALALAADPAFYGVAIETTSTAENNAAQTWAETNGRFFHQLSLDSAIGTSATNDTASTGQAAGYNYSLCMPTLDGKDYENVGLMVRQLSRPPGSSTWANKKIAGATPDPWSSTVLGHIKAKNALPYVTINGVAMTLYGRALSGRYADITIGKDWLVSQIQARVLIRMANAEKVNFDNEGISLFVSDVSGAMQGAQDANLVRPGWTVTVPDVSELNPTDIANRLLNAISFNAILRGAAQDVVINGTLSLTAPGS